MTTVAAGLTLRQCAERLDVHYMTVYRYVRLGMLPATKVRSQWRVDAVDLEAFQTLGAAGTGSGPAPWSERLMCRLIHGDEAGAWKVIEASMAAGLAPSEIHLGVIGPALRAVGSGWAGGEVSVAQEHAATASATRIVGRLGSRFASRGRRRGKVLIGSPPGERHGLAVAMAADLLRSVRYEVVELGCDLPADDFVAAVAAAEPVAVVAVSITSSDCLPAAADLIARLRSVTTAPILAGGRSADHDDAAGLGADQLIRDGKALLAL